MKSTLLLSFVEEEQIYIALDQISETLNLPKHQIFTFKVAELECYVLTYNLSSDKANIQYSSIWLNTVPIHRKKQTNTIYSLNAMNTLIKLENNGQFKRNHMIDWTKYSNQLMIVKNGRLKILDLRLVKINQ